VSHDSSIYKTAMNSGMAAMRIQVRNIGIFNFKMTSNFLLVR
jgi:hypothetical protein